MSSVIHRGNLCQPETVQESPEGARTGGSGPSLERTQAPGRLYWIERSRVFTRKPPVLSEPLPGSDDRGWELNDWVRFAEETFSSPSREVGGEKGSVCAVDDGQVKSLLASEVSRPQGLAQSLRGVSGSDVQKGSSTLLDYTLTQGENKEGDFRVKWQGRVSDVKNTYRFRAVIAGDMIDVYEYESFQVSQKGKKCGDRKKREDRTEEEKEEDRKRSLNRTRKGLIRVIDANVGRHGNERAKFFTMTLNPEHETFDLKQANKEFNKFIKRLEYFVEHKLQYTAITRFQDGQRPGGIAGGRGGAIHHHVVFYNLPYVPHEKLTRIWGRGFVWIYAIDDVDNLGVYVVEGYMGKEMDDPRLNGQKHYWSSRGLVKPDQMSSNDDLTIQLGIQDREPVYEATYTSEYVGTVHYRQYNLKREGKIYARKKKSRSTREPGASRNDNGTPRTGVDMVPPL